MKRSLPELAEAELLENERILREIGEDAPPDGDVFVDGMPLVNALEAAILNQSQCDCEEREVQAWYKGIGVGQ